MAQRATCQEKTEKEDRAHTIATKKKKTSPDTELEQILRKHIKDFH